MKSRAAVRRAATPPLAVDPGSISVLATSVSAVDPLPPEKAPKQKSPRRVPVKALKEFCKAHGISHAVFLGYAPGTQLNHVVTWGSTQQACVDTAKAGNRLKKAIGWPDKTLAESPILRRLKAEVKRLSEELQMLHDQTTPPQPTHHG